MERDLQQFEDLLKGLLSLDNATRRKAETVLERSRASNSPDTLISFLVTLMRRSHAPDVRQLCVILIRQDITRGIWQSLSPNVKESLKNNLLELVSVETERGIRKQVNHLVGVLASSTLPKGEWSNLLGVLFQLAQSPNPSHRESVFLIFEVVVEFNVESVRAKSGELQTALVVGLRDRGNPTVQLCALRAAAALLLAVDDREKPGMAEFVKLMFQVVGDAYEAKNDDTIREAVQTLVTVVRGEVGFLRNVVKPVVGAMVSISSNKALEGSTRRMGLELLLALAEAGKGMMRKNHEYCVAVVYQAFQFMLEIDPDLTAWAASQKEEDLEEEEQFQMGIEAVDRLAAFLGGKIFLSLAMPLVKQFLGAQSWQNRHAGLMSLAPMADRCRKLLSKQVDSLVGLVLPFVRGDQCVRVQWAAINAMAALTTIFAPEVQEKFHAQVLGAYIQGMNPSNHPRIVAHAALAVVDFCNGLHQAAEEDDEEPCPSNTPKPNAVVSQYLQALFGALVPLLQSNHVKLQEAALSAVSAMALVASTNFTPFYDTLMPGVKSILLNSNGKERREVRGKAIECVAVMGRAVGAEKFRADCKPIMETLLQTQKAGLASDDPVYNYVVQACARVCQAMGQEFTPYLEWVVPPLLKSAAISDAFEVSEPGATSSKDGVDGYESVTLSIRALGERRVTVNTSLLEEKATACNMLFQYASELKDGFFPFAEATAQVLIPLIPFPFNETVRIAAVDAMPSLLQAVRTTHDKRGGQEEVLRRLWNAMFDPIMQAMKQEVHLEYLNGILDSVGECLGALNFPVAQDQMGSLCGFLAELVKESQIRRDKRDEVRKSEDFDEEEAATLEEENEEEDSFLSSVYGVVAKLALRNGEAFLQPFHATLHPLFIPMLEPTRPLGQRTAALCVVDDVIQYCGAASGTYAQALLPVVTNPLTVLHADNDLRQAAVFGIGVCAQRLGPAFSPSFLSEAVARLVAIITAPEARDSERGEATDNAISAVGRICRFVAPNESMPIDGQPLLSLWLSWLPAREDEEEAKVVHSLLCDLVESGNRFLLGDKNANLPKVMSVFASVLGTSLVDEATSKRIGALVIQLQQRLGPQGFAQVLGGLSTEQQAALSLVR